MWAAKITIRETHKKIRLGTFHLATQAAKAYDSRFCFFYPMDGK
jgi:hypothetical protein